MYLLYLVRLRDVTGTTANAVAEIARVARLRWTATPLRRATSTGRHHDIPRPGLRSKLPNRYDRSLGGACGGRGPLESPDEAKLERERRVLQASRCSATVFRPGRVVELQNPSIAFPGDGGALGP